MRHQGTTLEKKQVATNPENGEVVKKTTHAYEPSDTDKSLARVERFTVIANWFVGAITALLAARFLLNLFGANAGAGFFQMIAVITTPLVAPFVALFGSPTIGQSFIDTAALVGLIVYPIVGYGVVKLVRAISAPPDPNGNAYTV
ncbi:MAG: YggT family protein [Vulcanimicrobiota bacterium]